MHARRVAYLVSVPSLRVAARAGLERTRAEPRPRPPLRAAMQRAADSLHNLA